MFSLTCTVSCLPMLSFAAPPDSASAGGYFLLNRCFSFLLLFSPEYCRITYSSPYTLKHLEATALNIPGKEKTKNKKLPGSRRKLCFILYGRFYCNKMTLHKSFEWNSLVTDQSVRNLKHCSAALMEAKNLIGCITFAEISSNGCF